MPTLYSSVIHLNNIYSVMLNHSGGQHAHAAFLDIVRAVDPSLAQKIHDQNGRKPFTISPLMGMPKRAKHEKADVHSEANQGIMMHAGWQCWLRVTILDDQLFKTFIDYFMNSTLNTSPSQKPKWERTLPEVRLGDAHFCMSHILTTPGSHPWAGYISLEDLQKRLDEPSPSSITFEFHTPTSFKLSGNNVETRPLPKLVFGNLATAWKALTGQNMVEAVEKYAESNWRLVIHGTKSKALMLHNRPQWGIIGRVEYQRLDDRDSPLARALNLLADLAFYTGLGRKTAQGMGMVRRVAGDADV